MRKRESKGISSAIAGLVVIVIILAAVAGYGWIRSPGAGSTVTVTSTVAGGGSGGAGSTVTSTVTTTLGGTSGATQNASLDALVSALVDKAKTEPAMTICTPTNPADFGRYITDFYRVFPWANGKVNGLSLGTSQCESRIVSEQKASHVTISIWYGDLAEGFTLASQGVTQNVSSLAQFMPMLGYGNNTYDPNGLWFPTTVDPTGIFCNTKALGSTPCPTTLQGLADPSLAGKLTMQDPALVSIVGDSFAFLEPSMGNASWTQLMKGIAANKPAFTSDAGTALTNVATGEFAVSYSELHDALGAEAKNYPVKFVWANPTPGTEQGDGLLKNSPSPALATLFLLNEASPVGQYDVFTYHSTVPANPVYAGYYAKIPTNVTLITQAPPNFYGNLDHWRAVYQSIFHTTG